MSDMVSIGISIRDQVSSQAPGIARAIEDIAKSGDEAMKSYADMERHVRSLNGALTDMNRLIQENRSRGGSPPVRGASRPSGISPEFQRMMNLPGNLMGGVAGMGTEGVGGMAGIANEGIGAFKGLGEGAMAAGAVAAALIGIVIGANKLAKVYENQFEGLMELNAALGKVSDSSDAMHESLRSTGDEAARYGYSLQQGLAARTGLVRAGAGGDVGTMDTAFAFERGTATDLGTITRALGYAGRFRGGPQGAMESAYGGFSGTGLQPGRFGEYLQTEMNIMEGALSRGVVKGFSETSRTMNWLYSGGELFRGPQGAQVYQQLESAITGSTALSSQKDILMYRAASGVLGRGSSFLDIQKQLERGLSPEMFDSIRKQVVSYAGMSHTDQVQMMRTMFGTTYTMAELLLKMPAADAIRQISAKGAPSFTGTPEMQALQAQQQIATNVARIGENTLSIRNAVLGVGAWATGGVANLLNNAQISNGARRALADRSKGGMADVTDWLTSIGSMGADQYGLSDDAARALQASQRTGNSLLGQIFNNDDFWNLAKNDPAFRKKMAANEQTGGVAGYEKAIYDLVVELRKLTGPLGDVARKIKVDESHMMVVPAS